MRALNKNYTDAPDIDFNNWLRWKQNGVVLTHNEDTGPIINDTLVALELEYGADYLQTTTELRFADPEMAAWFRLSTLL